MAELYNKIGLGLMGWSPVSFGLAQGDRQDESHGLVHKLLNKVQNSDVLAARVCLKQSWAINL